MAALTVIEERSVSKYLDAQRRNVPRLDDVWDGLVWRLARDPECGFLLVGSQPPLYVIRTGNWPGFPTIRAVYQYEARHWRVVIKKIQVI